jgi:hypothetical protein
MDISAHACRSGKAVYWRAVLPLGHATPQRDGAARIVAHDVERVLADIDADHSDRGIGCLRHSVLLVFGAPCQLRLLAGQERGQTIPLLEVASGRCRVGVDEGLPKTVQ